MDTPPEVITFPGKPGVGAGRPSQRQSQVANLTDVLSGIRNTDFSHTWAYSISEIWEAQSRAHESGEKIAEIYALIKCTSDALYVTAHDIDTKFTGQSIVLRDLQKKVVAELSGVGKTVDNLNITIGYIKRYQKDMTDIVERLDDAMASSSKKVSADVSRALELLVGDGGVVDVVEQRLIGTNGLTAQMRTDAGSILKNFGAAMTTCTNQILNTFNRKLAGPEGIAERTGNALNASAKKVDAELAETTKAAREAINRIAALAQKSHEDTLTKVQAIEQSIARFKINLGFLAISAFALVAAGTVLGATLVSHFAK